MKIKLKVTTKASENKVKQISPDFLEIKTTAVPEKGQANKQVLKLLSKFLKIPKSNLKIIKGTGSKNKTIEIF
ncbi:MAG TPA: DUF167 domain-containing protein [Patescibacteria group bacterium]|nr:DUF167 domain-containing protein [Patescibacteria group bacterium]